MLLLTNSRSQQCSKHVKVRLFVNGKYRKTLARYRPDDLTGKLPLYLNGQEHSSTDAESTFELPVPNAFARKRPRQLCLDPQQEAVMLSCCNLAMSDYGLKGSEWSTNHKYVGQKVLRYGFNMKTFRRWFTPAVIVAYFKPRRGLFSLHNSALNEHRHTFLFHCYTKYVVRFQFRSRFSWQVCHAFWRHRPA